MVAVRRLLHQFVTPDTTIASANEVGGLHSDAQIQATRELGEVPKVVKIRIALTGDSGAGKSALINSLTDIDDLAASLGDGKACTAVATYYEGALPGQVQLFPSTLEYLDIDGCERRIQGLIDAINVYLFEYDNDWEEEEKNIYMEAMESALKTLCEMACNLKDFQDDQSARAFMRKSYNGKSGDAMRMFMQLCQGKLNKTLNSEGDSVEYFEASTLTKLNNLTDAIVGLRAVHGRPTFWFLLNRVR